jgi:hypothetical protein
VDQQRGRGVRGRGRARGLEFAARVLEQPHLVPSAADGAADSVGLEHAPREGAQVEADCHGGNPPAGTLGYGSLVHRSVRKKGAAAREGRSERVAEVRSRAAAPVSAMPQDVCRLRSDLVGAGKTGRSPRGARRAVRTRERIPRTASRGFILQQGAAEEGPPLGDRRGMPFWFRDRFATAASRPVTSREAPRLRVRTATSRGSITGPALSGSAAAFSVPISTRRRARI